MAGRILSGVPVGLLGYLDGEPVAWCSIAPPPTYRRLVTDDTADQGVWSIACFFIKRALRGSGVLAQIIDAAVRHAHLRGAKVVEDYPVDQDSPSYRFMGFVPVFQKAEFVETRREGKRRHVMPLFLNSSVTGSQTLPRLDMPWQAGSCRSCGT